MSLSKSRTARLWLALIILGAPEMSWALRTAPPPRQFIFSPKGAICQGKTVGALLGANHLNVPADGDPIDINTYGDECRAVLGPIPPINCLDPKTSKELRITRNGAEAQFKEGKVWVDGKPLPLETNRISLGGNVYTVEKGNVVVTTGKGQRLVSQAFNDNGHRVSLDPKGNFLIDGIPPSALKLPDCDHPSQIPVPGADPCVLNSRIGIIRPDPKAPVYWMYNCHNTKSKEPGDSHYDFLTVVGTNEETGETCYLMHRGGGRFDMTHVEPPGGPDKAKRAKASAEWQHTMETPQCIGCHGMNQPGNTSPHTGELRVNGDGETDLIPETPLAKRIKTQWGYRIVGRFYNQIWQRPLAIVPLAGEPGTKLTADHTCTGCHVLTNQEDFLKLAKDSVGLVGNKEIAKAHSALTRKGASSVWMPPDAHDAADADTIAKLQRAVKNLERAVNNRKFRAEEREILSPCPTPAPLKREDLHGEKSATDFRWSWKYKNDHGHVPTRDDVRFEVTFRGTDGSGCMVTGISPEKLGADDWMFRQPTSPGVKYTYEVRAVRFCFDRQETASSAPLVFDSSELEEKAKFVQSPKETRQPQPASGH